MKHSLIAVIGLMLAGCFGFASEPECVTCPDVIPECDEGYVPVPHTCNECAHCIPAPGDFVWAIEVEDFLVHDVFRLGHDLHASGGRYLYQPESVENIREPSENAEAAFRAPRTAYYHVWLRMYAPSSAEAASYVGMNGAMSRVVPDRSGSYEWVKAGMWLLEEGRNRISLGHGQANARLDRIVIADYDIGPAELDAFIET